MDRFAVTGLGRREESVGVLDVTVEEHPIAAHDEHPVGTGAKDGGVSLLALAQRLLRPVMVDGSAGEVRGRLDEPELLAETIDDAGRDELSTVILAMAAKLVDR